MKLTKLLLSSSNALLFAAVLATQGQVNPTFTKVTTAGSIVTEAGAYLACAWGDYDNDGYPDLFVTAANSSAPQKNFLFHNNRDGTFTKITNTVVTAEARDWRGCSWVDYDNDGNLDLFVVSDNSGGFASENELFRNNGDGTFTKMTAASVGAIVLGVGNYDGPAWADYDRDGFVDCFVAGFSNALLYHNNGDASFSTVTSNIGLRMNNQGGFRAMWGDYDNDLWPDLSVEVNDSLATPGVSLVYHNLGNSSFTNRVPGLNTNYGNWAAGVWVDYDNGGYLDFFAVGSPTNLLYQNNKDGTFTKLTSATVANPDVCAWGDYDNDGFLDLYVVTETGAHLYHNNGDGTLSEVLSGALVGAQAPAKAVACTWVDYDNDGFLDLFVPYNAEDSFANNWLYHNNGNSNAWLKVKLVGTASNRSGIGAKVRVRASIRGQMISQMREINTGDGFSGAPLEAHFGLGDATNIDQVRVEWPSGIVQVLTNVPPRKFMTITEHQRLPNPPQPPDISGISRATNGAVTMAASGVPGLLYVFEVSTNLVNWSKVGVRSNATGVVSFTDARSVGFGKRFYRVTIP